MARFTNHPQQKETQAHLARISDLMPEGKNGVRLRPATQDALFTTHTELRRRQDGAFILSISTTMESLPVKTTTYVLQADGSIQHASNTTWETVPEEDSGFSKHQKINPPILNLTKNQKIRSSEDSERDRALQQKIDPLLKQVPPLQSLPLKPLIGDSPVRRRRPVMTNISQSPLNQYAVCQTLEKFQAGAVDFFNS